MTHDDIPAATRQAFEDLRASGTMTIVEELRLATDARNAGDAEFVCRVGVPHPNEEDLPAQVNLRVVIPGTFPLAPLDIYPVNPEVRGFPHQDAETRKLCLQPSSEAPWDNSRLMCYVKWAKEWLSDAVRGTLLAPGEPYELPDFSRKDLKPRLDRPLLFEGVASSLDIWQPWIGFSGEVTLQFLSWPKALVPVSFTLPDDSGERQTSFAEALLDTPVFHGYWLLLPEICVSRHRPAQTFDELRNLCEQTSIDFDNVLCSAWSKKDQDHGVLLVGFPISRFVGDVPSEIHWQPLVIGTWRQDKRKKRFRKQSTRQLFETIVLCDNFGPTKQLPWGKSTNITSERLYARGRHHIALRRLKTVVCGCGALGSAVSELLVRGGVSHLTLLDKERLEIGNLCRHTLDGVDVGRGKAEAMALRLLTTNPLADIKGFGAGLPLSSIIQSSLRDVKARLLAADLLVDCTTDEGAFLWLNKFAKTHRKRLVSLFFNFGATVLTLCVSGKHTSCVRVCRELYADIREGRTGVTPQQWEPKPSPNEYVSPGAGCWHSTFPAAGSHVWLLAAAAVDVLNDHLPKPIGADGLGVLIRRNAVRDCSSSPSPLVEVAWTKLYR